jgi:lysyl-tRNA synthetase class 2
MLEDIRQDKLTKLNNFKARGIDPFPAGPYEKEDIKDVLKKDLDESAKIAGRVMLLRDMGKITFLTLQDESGRMQVVLNQAELSDDYKFWVKNLDMGDFIGVKGIRFDTKKGERSVLAKKLTLLTKSILPLPDKFHGIEDEDEKLRRRYLDIIFNSEVRDLIYKRDKFWNSIRSFLKNRGFVEVETPVLETATGGADAKPFETHHNALDLDVYLRISMGELWQKRLMVAGLEKTFEIGRQFRNEGMDAEHLQDYTQMEFYWAYANYESGMELVEELFKYVAQETFGTLKFQMRGFEVDLGQPWQRYDYVQTVKEMTGVDVRTASMQEIEAKLVELGVNYDKEGFNITRAIDNLWKYCRKQLGGPGFLINEPLAVSPLAKKKTDNPELVERFHVIIAGSELGNGYSELNDPIDQAERFAQQQKLREAGDEEAQMFDHEFVEALEYGMPPTCGFGLSERVFSFFMNKPGRECQIFPLMKPKAKNGELGTANYELESDENELGVDYDQAKKLVDAFITNPITRLHLRESEVIMRSLAKYFGEDEEKWGIIGLLHDIDWDLTKDDTLQHCKKLVEILKTAGAADFLIETIVSHGYGNEKCGAPLDKQRATRLQHSLAAAETLTGLIIASVLVRPDKKIANLELASLKKKFKNKAFAANCNRDIIMECEKAGIVLDDFLAIGLEALQEVGEELGF